MEVNQEKVYKALVAVKAVSALYLVYNVVSLSSVLVEHGCRFMAVIK